VVCSYDVRDSVSGSGEEFQCSNASVSVSAASFLRFLAVRDIVCCAGRALCTQWRKPAGFISFSRVDYHKCHRPKKFRVTTRVMHPGAVVPVNEMLKRRSDSD
jgi:hypothetical protein